MTAPVQAEEHRAAQAAEFGRYKALEVIYINGARAFNPGDPVPISHVERGVVSDEQVEDLQSSKSSNTAKKG